MSIKERNLSKINRTILNLHDQATEARPGLRRAMLWTRLWGAMLHHEFVKNDVAIRAQSLSYFTLFSILPLIAGIFLVLGFFSQWGPVQREFETLLSNLLSSIPPDERKTLISYILQFKDQYLANLTEKSGSIGAFAIVVLFWIGARVFFNIESLMNRIWSVRAERPLMDRLRNFVFCMVLMPFAYALVISLPKVVELWAGKSAGMLLDGGLLALLVLSSLFAVLKLLPNTPVSTKSALAGAGAGTLLFAIANAGLKIYFRVGTQSAYGKAGVLPLFAFFIYVAWVIFIGAVEVSLLVEQGKRILERKLPQTTLAQALILEKLLTQLRMQFLQSEPAMTVKKLSERLGVGPVTLEPLIDFLERRDRIIRSRLSKRNPEYRITLAHHLEEEDLIILIKDFLKWEALERDFDVSRVLSTVSKKTHLTI